MPSAGTGAPGPSDSSTPTVSSAPLRKRISKAAVAGIALVVILVVILGLIASGLLPGVSFLGASHGSSGISTEASEQALPSADATAHAHGAGPLYAVVGLSTTTSFQFGNEQDIGNGSCPVSGGLASNLTVAAATGNYSSGALEGWLFVYYNSTTSWASWVGVFGGQSEDFGHFAGGDCLGVLPVVRPLPPTYLDSTAAAAAAATVSAAFVSSHPEASVEYALSPSTISDAPPVWHLDYTTCDVGPNSGQGSGDSFNVYLNALDGAVLSHSTTHDQACALSLAPAPPPLGPVEGILFDQTLSGTLNSTFYFVQLSLEPTSGLSTSGFGLLLTNTTTHATVATSSVPATCVVGDAVTLASGACAAPASGWYAVLANATNAIVDLYGGSNANWSGVAPLTGADTLYVLSNVPVQDYLTLSPYTFGSAFVFGGLAL
jgi:hypothetical protein